MSQARGLRRFWRDNALSTVVLGCFLLFWVGQSVAGLDSYNQDRASHRPRTVTYSQDLRTSHFWEATSENWESEFMQMGFFVVLTVYLKQRGSAASNPYPDEPQGQEQQRKQERASGQAPDAGRRAGRLYRNSLSLALLVLFGVSFAVHVVSGALTYSQEQLEHGQKAVTAWRSWRRPTCGSSPSRTGRANSCPSE